MPLQYRLLKLRCTIILFVFFCISTAHGRELSREPEAAAASLGVAADIATCIENIDSVVERADRLLENLESAPKPDPELSQIRRCMNQVFNWQIGGPGFRDRELNVMSTILEQASLSQLRVKLNELLVLDFVSALAMDFRFAGMRNTAVRLQRLVVSALVRKLTQPYSSTVGDIADQSILRFARARLALLLIENNNLEDAERVLKFDQAAKGDLEIPPVILAEHLDVMGLLAARRGEWMKAAEQHKMAIEQLDSYAMAGEAQSDFEILEAEYRNNFGVALQFQSRFSAAREQLEQAYHSRHKLLESEHPVLAESLYNLAGLKRDQGQSKEARLLLELALGIQVKKFGAAHPSVADTLNNLALVNADVGDYATASKLLSRSCQSIQMKSEFSVSYTTCLHNQSYLASLLGRHGRAIKLERRALKLRQQLLPSPHPLIASSMNSLGMLAGLVGKLEEQQRFLMDAYDQRVDLLGEVHALTAVSLHNLGYAAVARGEIDDAKSLFTQALVTRLAILESDHQDVALTRANLAFVNLLLGDSESARSFSNTALTIYRKNHDVSPARLAHLYNILGQVAANESKQDEAENYYLLALAHLQGAQYPELQSHVEFQLALAVNGRGGRLVAIGFLKRAVGRLLSVTKTLEPYVQLSYLSSNQQLFRQLARWLLAENRLAEANSVLDLLDQYQNNQLLQTRGDPQALPLSIKEANDSDTLDAILRDIQKRLHLGTPLSGSLSRLWESLTTGDSKKKVTETTACRAIAITEEFANEENSLSGLEVSSQIARLRYIVFDDSVQVVVGTVDKQWVCEIVIDKIELSEKIDRFRSVILQRQRPNPSATDTPASELYQLLFSPVEDLLTGLDIHGLILDQDSVLNLVPFGALSDGINFLGQKYALSISSERLGSKPLINDRQKMAGFGLSQPHSALGGSALPWVRVELRDIVIEQESDEGFLPGKIFLDDAFTLLNYRAMIDAETPILHVTGHFELDQDEFSRSFFHAGGGGYLFLDQLLEPVPGKSNSLEDVEILVVPSCETALLPHDSWLEKQGLESNAQPAQIEGLAAGAMRAGAKAVFASLWDVDDASMAALTKRLYRYLSKGWSPAIALQRARLDFIEGKVSCERQQAHAISNHKDDAFLVSELDVKQYCPANLKSPYHWAGLVVFGGENL